MKKSCCVRFNLDNPEHRQAWIHLQNIDRREYKSYSEFVIAAIFKYFEDDNKLITELRTIIREEISNLQLVAEVPKASTNNEDDIDWDFLGG